MTLCDTCTDCVYDTMTLCYSMCVCDTDIVLCVCAGMCHPPRQTVVPRASHVRCSLCWSGSQYYGCSPAALPPARCPGNGRKQVDIIHVLWKQPNASTDLVLQHNGGHVGGGEGVGVECPSAIPHGLAHAPLHHQSREGGVHNGCERQQVHNFYLSLAVFCEHV